MNDPHSILRVKEQELERVKGKTLGHDEQRFHRPTSATARRPFADSNFKVSML